MKHTVKKVALLGPGDLRLQSMETPLTLQRGMVKVRVLACGICGSDLSLLSGTRDLSKENYFGHEFSGVVKEISDDSSGFVPGMRVASELAVTCGRCWNCRNGLSNYCRSMNDAFFPGGFTEETLVRVQEDYSFLREVPEDLDDITASMAEPTNCAYRIAMQAQIKPGEHVVIFGLGAMGIISALILKQMGAGSIVCVGRRLARQKKIPQFDPLPIFRKEIFLVGAKGPYVYSRPDGGSAVLFMMRKIRENLRKILNTRTSGCFCLRC